MRTSASILFVISALFSLAEVANSFSAPIAATRAVGKATAKAVQVEKPVVKAAGTRAVEKPKKAAKPAKKTTAKPVKVEKSVAKPAPKKAAAFKNPFPKKAAGGAGKQPAAPKKVAPKAVSKKVAPKAASKKVAPKAALKKSAPKAAPKKKIVPKKAAVTAAKSNGASNYAEKEKAERRGVNGPIRSFGLLGGGAKLGNYPVLDPKRFVDPNKVPRNPYRNNAPL